MQWLKFPAWKVGDRGFAPHSGLQASKKQNVSSPLTVRDVACSVFGGQCHLIHLNILRGFPGQFSLYVHRGGLKTHLFDFIPGHQLRIHGYCNFALQNLVCINTLGSRLQEDPCYMPSYIIEIG